MTHVGAGRLRSTTADMSDAYWAWLKAARPDLAGLTKDEFIALHDDPDTQRVVVGTPLRDAAVDPQAGDHRVPEWLGDERPLP